MGDGRVTPAPIDGSFREHTKNLALVNPPPFTPTSLRSPQFLDPKTVNPQICSSASPDEILRYRSRCAGEWCGIARLGQPCGVGVGVGWVS